ncbi:unnamed protein product, partial [Gulo gulo]
HRARGATTSERSAGKWRQRAGGGATASRGWSPGRRWLFPAGLDCEPRRVGFWGRCGGGPGALLSPLRGPGREERTRTRSPGVGTSAKQGDFGCRVVAGQLRRHDFWRRRVKHASAADPHGSRRPRK